MLAAETRQREVVASRSEIKPGLSASTTSKCLPPVDQYRGTDLPVLWPDNRCYFLRRKRAGFDTTLEMAVAVTF